MTEDKSRDINEIKKPKAEKNIKLIIIKGVEGTPNDNKIVCIMDTKMMLITDMSLNFDKKLL